MIDPKKITAGNARQELTDRIKAKQQRERELCRLVLNIRQGTIDAMNEIAVAAGISKSDLVEILIADLTKDWTPPQPRLRPLVKKRKNLTGTNDGTVEGGGENG